MNEPLFEVISDSEYAEAQAASEPAGKEKKPKWNTDVRTRTNWWKLPTHLGFCTVPLHAEVQAALTDEEKQYRKNIETRMVFEIGPYMVCRDCFVVEADKESVTDDHGIST